MLMLLIIPIFGLFYVINVPNIDTNSIFMISLFSSIFTFAWSGFLYTRTDFSTNEFQFVHEVHKIMHYDFNLGIDGLSIFFVLLTTTIFPISILSGWNSISVQKLAFLILILCLETLLLAVFLVLDVFLFYIFFESILPPLFILIGIFGSDNRIKASFYLFLYTLVGSLFLLLSIISMSATMSTTEYNAVFKRNFFYIMQLYLFCGIFIAFAVKTPVIFLNTWLLKAHVESPLGGSILLAAIVLKLSVYGIFRLILVPLAKAYMVYTFVIFLIGVITIVYASLSTLRTIDVKELIAYSSVSHAAVYLLSAFSNSIQGIAGSINLGLAHGLVSPGLFICAGGVLYDRCHTRLISVFKGMAQLLPLFSILFLILCLANCGVPLTLNFVGEFMSLYGVFERSSLYGVLASSSIVFSAAYTMYMYQRISFGGSYSKMLAINIPDLTSREFMILLPLVVLTVVFGIYTAPILDGLNYSVSTLIYMSDFSIITCEGSDNWGLYFNSINTFVPILPIFNAKFMFILNIVLFVLYFFIKYTGYLNFKVDYPKPFSFTNLPLQSTGNPFSKGESSSQGNSEARRVAEETNTNSSQNQPSESMRSNTQNQETQNQFNDFQNQNTRVPKRNYREDTTQGETEDRRIRRKNYHDDDTQDNIEYRNNEDRERIKLHLHQVDKVRKLGLQEIADKADRGEPLTEKEEELWEEGDQDLDGNDGHLGEPSRQNLDDSVRESLKIVEDYQKKIANRNRPNYELSDYEDDDENLLLPVLGVSLLELPILRGVFILYTAYKSNAFPILNIQLEHYFKKYAFALIYLVFIIILSIFVYNYYYLDSIVTCESSDNWSIYFNSINTSMQYMDGWSDYVLKLVDDSKPCSPCYFGDCVRGYSHIVNISDYERCPCCGLTPRVDYGRSFLINYYNFATIK